MGNLIRSIIFHFQQKMALETRNETILCKVFFTTLSRPALVWFRQMPEKSIDSFEDLCNLFIQQYSSNHEQQKTMVDLHCLVQSEDKTPQQYLVRFMDVMNMIYNVDLVTVAGSFIKGLFPSSIQFEDLIKHSPYDMTEVRSQAEGIFRVLETKGKLNKKLIVIQVNDSIPNTPTQSKRAYSLSSQGGQSWNKRQRADRQGNFNYNQ